VVCSLEMTPEVSDGKIPGGLERLLAHRHPGRGNFAEFPAVQQRLADHRHELTAFVVGNLVDAEIESGREDAHAAVPGRMRLGKAIENLVERHGSVLISVTGLLLNHGMVKRRRSTPPDIDRESPPC